MAQPPKKPKRPAGKARKAPESVDRPSSIDRMDQEIRDEIFRLRFGQGRHIHEIIAHLKAMGAEPPSPTALGRHLKGLSEQMKAKMDAELGMLAPAMQFANAFAEAVTSKIEAADGDNKLRATRELMQTQIFRMVIASASAAEDNPDAPVLSVKELFALSRTLQTLAQAERTEDQRIREAVEAALAEQKRIADEQRAAAAEAAAQVVKKGGMSAETVELVFKTVLGDA